MKIVLTNQEPGMNPSSRELAEVIVSRIGLEPRKKGSTDKMYSLLLELYERSKLAYREKKPEAAIMTVEEMALYAGITRQTMYEYLKRWLSVDFITKTSYIKEGKVIIGYKLNGTTLESSFDKVIQKIKNNLETTQKYIIELQRIVKNEKISKAVIKQPQKSLQKPFEPQKQELTEKNDEDSRPLE